MDLKGEDVGLKAKAVDTAIHKLYITLANLIWDLSLFFHKMELALDLYHEV